MDPTFPEITYFKITIHLEGRKPMSGIRGYKTSDTDKVYYIASGSILQLFPNRKVLKLDIWPMPTDSEEVREYIKKQELQKKNR